MDTLFRFASTAAAGSVELWAGVPLGLSLGLPYPLVWLAAVSGNLGMATLALVGGEPIRRWAYSRRWLSKRRKRVERIWNRYGIASVALQAPLITGTPAAIVVSLALGAPPCRLMCWIVPSVMIWAAAGIGAAALGISIFDA